MNNFTTLNPRHRVAIQAVGWGEPKTFYITCSCGWTGFPVHERLSEDPAAFLSLLPEPGATVARTFGIEAILNEGEIFGTSATALVQVLVHCSYDPAADDEATQKLLEKATEALLTATTMKQAHDARRLMDVAANERVESVERKLVWAEEPRPVKPVFIPEAHAMLKRPSTKENDS